jgi:hypothetical protein
MRGSIVLSLSLKLVFPDSTINSHSIQIVSMSLLKPFVEMKVAYECKHVNISCVIKGATTLSITTFSITTLNIKGLFVTLIINDSITLYKPIC